MLVDIHHHLLYGVDDGARTARDMLCMLTNAQAQGISHIIATPHAIPGEKEFPMERCRRHLAMVQEMCRENGFLMDIHLGAEIFYSESALRLLAEGRIPTLAGTKYVLVEFAPDVKFDELCQAARRLGNMGYQSIFAHVERYRCLRRMKHLEQLHEEYQVLCQTNAHTVLRKQGFFERRWLRSAIESGLIDMAASDAHNVNGRRCRLGECYRELQDSFGEDIAQRLCVENPGSILEG